MRNETATIERIRSSYVERKTTKLDELKELDRNVRRPAEIFAYAFGTVGALTLGTGMSLSMKVIGASLPFAMPLGIGVGLLGLLIAALDYPIYKAILTRRKRKYARRIFELSDDLLNK